ncbi:MAG TPA: hypothetical protein PLV25_07785, partial [Opitutales bacterium]|nr:hypothetical protein [Opitutales bacterium]
AHQAKIRHLLQSNTAFTWDTLIVPLDQLSDELERFWSPISHLHAVSNTAALRDCYEACLPQLSAYDAAIHHNKALYDAIHCIDTHDLSPAQQKTLSDTKQSFELAGVLLNDAQKIVFEQLDTELSQLSNQFENNLLDSSGNANHGSGGSVSFSGGKVGQAGVFNGSGGVIVPANGI